MATSLYFNNFESSMEQHLIEDLVIESIRIYGNDVYYIPRTAGAKDDILNEDDLSTYNRAYFIEMYIKNVDGFEGEGEFLSKFGVEVRDEVILTVSKRSFELGVSSFTGNIRPLEGDLIYFPMARAGSLWEINFVEHEAIFYQMGQLQTYDLKLSLFEYSNETFNTGVEQIDNLFEFKERTSNTSIEYLETQDTLADNFTIEEAADDIIDFTEANPFSEGGRW